MGAYWLVERWGWAIRIWTGGLCWNEWCLARRMRNILRGVSRQRLISNSSLFVYAINWLSSSKIYSLLDLVGTPALAASLSLSQTTERNRLTASFMCFFSMKARISLSSARRSRNLTVGSLSLVKTSVMNTKRGLVSSARLWISMRLGGIFKTSLDILLHKELTSPIIHTRLSYLLESFWSLKSNCSSWWNCEYMYSTRSYIVPRKALTYEWSSNTTSFGTPPD